MISTLRGLGDAVVQAGTEPHAAVPILRSLHEEGGLRKLLRAVIDTNETLRQVARHSYRHPNGFDRVVLLDGGADRHKVRLHLWWPTDPVVEEQIHNHAWNFSSVLLTGALRFQIYETVSTGDSKLHYESLPPLHGTTGYRLRYVGETAVACSFDALLRQGALYTLDHKVFHRVSRTGADVTGTLVLHGPFVRQHSEIVADGPMDEQHETRVHHFSEAELRAKLLAFLDAFDQ